MGEIADMMLDGTLDEQTGEYIGDKSRQRFGSESPGFPVTYDKPKRRRKRKNRTAPAARDRGEK